MVVIDVNKENKKAKNRFIVNLVLIIALIVGYIAASILIFILSNNDYLVPLVIDIILSALALSFIVFYFLNIFPIVKHYYRFYHSLSNSTNTKKRILTYEKEDENKYRDGVKYRQFVFSYEESGKKFFDRIQVLDADDLVLEAGQAYKIYTFQNVLLAYEVYQYAKA